MFVPLISTIVPNVPLLIPFRESEVLNTILSPLANDFFPSFVLNSCSSFPSSPRSFRTARSLALISITSSFVYAKTSLLFSGRSLLSFFHCSTSSSNASLLCTFLKIHLSLSRASTPSTNSPRESISAMSICACSFCRITFFNVAAPNFSRNAVNIPPRSMLVSWRSSPTPIIFAPASQACFFRS